MRDSKDALVIGSTDQFFQTSTRRSFLRMLGVGGSVVLLPSLFACDDDDDDDGTNPGGNGAVVLNLSNDTGILNYAYALEQLEAAFYQAAVTSAAFASLTTEQQEVVLDVRNVEVIHRQFLRQLLGTSRVPDLAFNTATVASLVATPAAILKNSEMLEDNGVAAYNGAGKFLTVAANLTVAGKIVSVEARHVAAFRDLREGLALPGTPANTRFAGDDVINAQGLDVKHEPSTMLAKVAALNVVSTTTPISIGTPPSVAGTADASPPQTP